MDIWKWIAGFLFGVVGMAYFVYGKKQQAWMPLFCGLALMIYPYFVSNLIVMIGVGIALIVLPYFFRE